MCCGSTKPTKSNKRRAKILKSRLSESVSALSVPKKTFLMCRPDHFGIHYQINPWMNVSNPASNGKAIEDWNFLCDRIREHGGTIANLRPQPGLPDMVFTANAGLIVKDKSLAILSRFRHKERQGEEVHFSNWFSEHGLRVIQLDLPFEGAGDALFLGDILVCGYGFRTDLDVYNEIAFYVPSFLTVRLVDPRFYHLDTCFCPLSDKSFLYYPGAFDEESQAILQDLGESFAVPDDEAANFACNAVIIGNSVILPKSCPKTCEWLKDHSYLPVECDMSEFLKSGGACKCLTLAV